MILDAVTTPPVLGTPASRKLDLGTVPAEQWLQHLGSPVAVPAPLEYFLKSVDLLTDCTLDLAELALERHYGLSLPWRLVTDRGGYDDEGNRSFTGFYLHRFRAAGTGSN